MLSKVTMDGGTARQVSSSLRWINAWSKVPSGDLACVVERFALGVQAGEVGGIDVVAAFVLGLEDELVLACLRHAVRIPPRLALAMVLGSAGSGRSS
jgi:hypothetical protein